MQYQRSGLVFQVTAPSQAIADTFEHLFATWPDDEREISQDLGDLTAYNQARAHLLGRVEVLQALYDEMEAEVRDGRRSGTAELEGIKAQRDAISELLRASARPE